MYSLGYERLLPYQSETFLIRTSGNGAFPFRCSELLSLLSSCVEEPVDYQLSCKKLGTWNTDLFLVRTNTGVGSRLFGIPEADKPASRERVFLELLKHRITQPLHLFFVFSLCVEKNIRNARAEVCEGWCHLHSHITVLQDSIVPCRISVWWK